MAEGMNPDPMQELEAKRAENRAAMDARDAELRTHLSSAAASGQVVESGYGSGSVAGGSRSEQIENIDIQVEELAQGRPPINDAEAEAREQQIQDLNTQERQLRDQDAA